MNGTKLNRQSLARVACNIFAAASNMLAVHVIEMLLLF